MENKFGREHMMRVLHSVWRNLRNLQTTQYNSVGSFAPSALKRRKLDWSCMPTSKLGSFDVA